MTISKGSNVSEDQLIAAIFSVLESAYGTSPWTRSQLKADYNQANTEYFFLVDDDHVIGFLSIQDLFGEIELTNIAVAKAYQNQGFAKQLLSNLDSFEEPIFLEVRQSNQKAQDLYLQFGFEIIGHRKAYYHNPIEDAILMKREHL